MPKTCACHGCTNRSSRLSNVSFHRFPHGDPDLLLKWVTSISREGFQPTANHSVCSEHFVRKAYLQGVHPRDGPKGMSYKLLAQAVPTVITSHEPMRRPRRPKSHQKQALLIKTQCPGDDDDDDDEKVAFQPLEVLNEECSDKSGVSLHVQQQKSEVTEQTLLVHHVHVHSPNTESRNQLDLVSDELRFTAPSGVVQQEPKYSNEHQSQVEAQQVMIDRASAESMERELNETKFKLQESRKEVNILKQKLKRRDVALSKLLKVLKDQRIISREPIVNHSVCSEDILREDCSQEVHLRDGDEGVSEELLGQTVETHQPGEQKSRRKQTLPKKRQCPEDNDDVAFQPPEKINGSDDRSTASSHVQQQESEVTEQTLQDVPNKEAQNRLDLVSVEHRLTASSCVIDLEQTEEVAAHKVMRTLPELVSIDRCVYSNHLPKT